jgi:hypothetical protein
MGWRHFTSGPYYQPQLPSPTITVISVIGSRVTVTIRSEVPDALLFYRLGRPSFVECPSEFTLLVPPGMMVEAYAAKQGYNNSEIATYTVPLPEEEE